DAGHDDQAARVDLLLGAREPSDVRDQAALDADVGGAHGQARTIDDPATFDDRVKRHVTPSRGPTDIFQLTVSLHHVPAAVGADASGACRRSPTWRPLRGRTR